MADGGAERGAAGGQAGRLDVTFSSGDATCGAWLYLPNGPGPHAAVVMAHGLGANREMGLAPYAERFRDAGYACLVFDYRHFGASGGEPRELLDVGRQLEDWRAALAYARGREDLDGQRLAIWGTSFGGGHAISIAAEDAGIAAAVAQCPFTDGISSTMAVNPLTSARVAPLAIRDLLAARAGRERTYVAVAGPPRGAALMTAPDALPGMEALTGDTDSFPNRACAGVGLAIIGYRPGRKAADIAAPVLFAICENDTVAPARATKRHAARAPRGEVRLYPEGHFDIYRGEGFERAVADQLEFLRRHVPPTPA